MKRIHNQVVYKEYTMGQIQLPTNIEDLIPANHLVRVVNNSIEKMDISKVKERYKGGGTSSYHPKMMLKVLVYAYAQRIYSSRQIAKALRENINFMWISGNSRPDFRTINRFRGEILKGIIQDVFAAVLEFLIDEGYVKLEHYFVDGTKVEANANKYRYVWAKNTRRYKQRLQEKIRELLEEIEQVNEEENAEYGDKDLEELGKEGRVDPERLEQTVEELNRILEEKLGEEPVEEQNQKEKKRRQEQIDAGQLELTLEELQERLSENPEDGQLKQAIKKLKNDYLPRQRKYEEQERKLNGRNSYATTDVDATFMRMKGEHPEKSLPKAAYNIQMGTENQFVVGFSVHQQPADSGCLIPHLEGVKARLGRLPKNIIADAGYGSEENYTYLEQQGVRSYVKYNTFHQEQTKRRKKKGLFRSEDFTYDEGRDEFICPAQKRMIYLETRQRVTINGYSTHKRIYEAEECNGCPLKPQCTRAFNNRRLQVSFRLQQLRTNARSNLDSEEGQKLRSQRGTEVESVFGQIKHNKEFKRFRLRGQEKAEVECGLHCIAINIQKVAR